MIKISLNCGRTYIANIRALNLSSQRKGERVHKNYLKKNGQNIPNLMKIINPQVQSSINPKHKKYEKKLQQGPYNYLKPS